MPFQNIQESGRPLEIRDEGIAISTNVASIDFTGGITGSAIGDAVTENVSGSSGGFSVETPAGTVDGSNLIFTVSNTPKAVVIDNITYFGSGDGYTYSLGTITCNSDRPPVSSIKSLY